MKGIKRTAILGLAALAGILLLTLARPTESAQDTLSAEAMSTAKGVPSGAKPEPPRSEGEPRLNQDSAPDPASRQLYFGEQHLHSSWSPDAYAAGTRQKPEDAYRFALGEEITLSTTGEKIKKSTPYDFVALTDHAEYLGVFPQLADPNGPFVGNALAALINSTNVADQAKGASEVIASITSAVPSGDFVAFVSPEIIQSNWKRHVEIANRYNDPGKFTALIAFEWTSIPNSQNMHRNVFFRDDTGPEVPYSSFDSVDPEDLWTYLEIQRNAGHENFAIPHNGNVSNGLMYAPTNYRGDPIDARYAKRRALNEPATEMIQTKGSSDTHPLLSPNDEFANFEQFPNLIGTSRVSKIRYGYVRQALTDGLLHEQKLGTNPFKFGIVAGADVHSGISANEEDNWYGAHGATDDTPKKRLDPKPGPAGEPGYVLGTAGATAVWADENTRAGIFDAMRRKETYGTSGPLIRLRFFGGWNYADGLVDDAEFVKNAYADGVPMGGDMPSKPAAARAPKFAVWALKDPESGNLDRVQIIKGWVDQGIPKEKIYDVALSDGRTVDPATGYVKPVGNTVDVRNASYTNDIGDSQLSVVWQDPDFDPSLPAVYYVRVLEIPTPRWSTYDAKKLGVDPPAGVPATIQERAWSSPIWYTPPAE
jgi:hypothetical protein